MDPAHLVCDGLPRGGIDLRRVRLRVLVLSNKCVMKENKLKVIAAYYALANGSVTLLE
jgi:hypothetical protein